MLPVTDGITEERARKISAEKNAETRSILFEEIEELREVIEELREENEKLKKRVGMEGAGLSEVPEDMPQLMRYVEIPRKDREAYIGDKKNALRAIQIWELWDIYADCGGEKETLHVSEIRKILKTRGAPTSGSTITRVLNFMERLGEGFLTVEEDPQRQGRLVVREMSLDEWRQEKYAYMKREREKRRREIEAEKEEEAEKIFTAKAVD